MAALQDRILQTFQAGIEVGGENNIKIHSPSALCAEFIHAAWRTDLLGTRGTGKPRGMFMMFILIDII